jgi:membrane protein implicated in regulation of membrane protease activity
MRMNRFDRMRFRLWRPALIAAVVIAVVLAIAIVATSLILILAPIALVAVIAHRLFARRAMRQGGARADPDARYRVIDAEYEVISTRPEDRPRRD